MKVAANAKTIKEKHANQMLNVSCLTAKIKYPTKANKFSLMFRETLARRVESGISL